MTPDRIYRKVEGASEACNRLLHGITNKNQFV